MHHNFLTALIMTLILVTDTFAAPSVPNTAPYHIQSFAEKVAGIAEPFDASDCQPGEVHCDTLTTESYHVVTWIFALIGMAILALLFFSYCIAVLTSVWHRTG
jgi:hypothetical protein